MIDGILTLDCAEHGLKYALHTLPEERDRRPRRILQGTINGIGGDGRLQAWDESGQLVESAELSRTDNTDVGQAINMLSHWIRQPARDVRLIGIAHRVVHGASRESPELLDDTSLASLDRLSSMAPTHQPSNLAGVRAGIRFFPKLPQIACYDTAYHLQQPQVARTLPLPAEFANRGLVHYGFNGLAFESVASRLQMLEDDPPRRLVVIHLGSDASMCAIRNGRSVAVTTGFSMLEGLPTATASGAIDPGVLLYLLREEGMSVDQLEHLLYRRSGLMGVSGFSADMRVLLESKFPRAAVAVELFCYRIIRELGSLAAALQGLDGIVFSGRIGVSAIPVRAAVCRNAGWLGLRLDEGANLRREMRLHHDQSRVRIWAMSGERDWIMARQAARLLQGIDSNDRAQTS